MKINRILESNKTKVFLTIFLSGIAFAINYFINFFLTRYVTKNIGTGAYGYVSLAKTFASYAMIATSSLNSFSSRFISIAYHNQEYKKANQYFNSVFWSDIIIGFILIVLCIIILQLPVATFEEYNGHGSDVSYLFLLVFINLFFNLSMTAFQSAAIISNNVHIVAVGKLLSYFGESIILLVLFGFFLPHIYYVGFGMIVATFVLLLFNIYICKKYTSELKVDFRHFRSKYVRELVYNGMWNSLNNLGNTLNSGLDLLTSNILLGSYSMGLVSIVKTMTSIFSGFYTMVAQPFEPIFLKCYANHEEKKLLYNLKFSMKISGLISNLAFSGVVAYGLYYYKLWIPNEDSQLLYNLTVIAVATSIFEGAIYPLYYIYTLTIKNKLPCVITIVGGCFNLISMILLINKFNCGVYAIFISTAVVMLVINGVTNPIYMAKCLGLKYNYFYSVLAKHTIACLVMTIFMMLISKMFEIDNWLQFIVAVICSAAFGGIIHILIMFDKTELSKLKKIIFRI